MSFAISGLQCEPYLHCDLPVIHLVVLNVTAHFADFKPAHIAYCLARAVDRIVHRVFNAGGRGADQLDLFVDVITHKFSG